MTTLQLSLQKALIAASAATRRLPVLFEWERCTVELLLPHALDLHLSHEQDEMYFIASGTGKFRRQETRIDFAAGDLLFVPAQTEHCFEAVSSDFTGWAVLFSSAPLHHVE